MTHNKPMCSSEIKIHAIKVKKNTVDIFKPVPEDICHFKDRTFYLSCGNRGSSQPICLLKI